MRAESDGGYSASVLKCSIFQFLLGQAPGPMRFAVIR
jgi:hypothetical protein